MALPALKIHPEDFMEERIARIEANIAHIHATTSHLKENTLQLRDDVGRLENKFDASGSHTAAQFQETQKNLSALMIRVEKGFGRIHYERMGDRVWFLLMAAGMLAVVARSFKWI